RLLEAMLALRARPLPPRADRARPHPDSRARSSAVPTRSKATHWGRRCRAMKAEPTQLAPPRRGAYRWSCLPLRPADWMGGTRRSAPTLQWAERQPDRQMAASRLAEPRRRAAPAPAPAPAEPGRHPPTALLPPLARRRPEEHQTQVSAVLRAT